MPGPLVFFDDRFEIDPSVFIAPNATVTGRVAIGADSSIWFGVVVRADTAPISIGRATSIQDNSVIHVDSDKPVVIGDEVTVGHRAIVHGATVESRVVIGMGSIILNNALIGAESVIGAGTVVVERARIPPRSLVLGVPGRVIREVTDKELAYITRSAVSYIEYARFHKGKASKSDAGSTQSKARRSPKRPK